MSDNMSDKEKKSDKDTVNIEGVGTDKERVWITIKDASDLLGYSERHTWRLATKCGWKQRKKLNNLRRKVYVPRDEVEEYYKQEQERQKLEQLNSDNPDKTDNTDPFAKSDKPMSDKSKVLSDNQALQRTMESLPILLSDYKKMQEEYHNKQEKLIRDKAFWKTSALWIIGFTVVVSAFLSYYIYDTKLTLSDRKQELSDIRLRLSGKDNQMQELTKRVNSLSDKVIDTQDNLLGTKETLSSKKEWINTLEGSMSERKLEQIRQERKEIENKESKDNKQD